MEQVLRFIADYQWWIYGVLGLILLFYVRLAIVARRQGARSIFKLEQEQSQVRYSRSVIVSAVVLLVMVAVFVLANPLLPAADPVSTPTPTVTTGPLAAATLTATPPPPTITATATATRERPTRPPQITPTFEVVATPEPQVRPAACPDPNVRITSPGVNQVVQGNVAVRGTANLANFDYYKVEVGAGADPAQWTVVGQLHRGPVNGGVLETLNSNAYPPGIYTLRLVVVDVTGNYPDPCRVTINIQR